MDFHGTPMMGRFRIKALSKSYQFFGNRIVLSVLKLSRQTLPK